MAWRCQRSIGRGARVLPLVPVLAAALPLAAPLPLRAVEPPTNLLQERSQRFHPIESGGGMVAAQEQRAAAVGAEILRRGGNAVDAAVASSFALAVTLPQAGNLGGGGFLLLWLPRTGPIRTCAAAARQPALPQAVTIGRGEAVAVNFRETAPAAARADLFLRPDGSVDRERATRSLLSTAVPGTVAGLTLVQRRYGCLPLAAVLQPAIDLAERGFPVGESGTAERIRAGFSAAGVASFVGLDGATRWQILRHLVFPLAKPGMVAVFLVTLLTTWNSFVIPLIFSRTEDSQTMTVVLTLFIGQYEVSWEAMSAAAVVTMLPPFLLALFFQRYLVRGLTMGAVKG